MLVFSNDTSLMEEETALLFCAGRGSPYTEIFWTRNEVTLTNTSLTSTYHEEILQGGRTFTLSVLQLCSVGFADAGTYTCVVSNGEMSTVSFLELVVTGKENKN